MISDESWLPETLPGNQQAGLVELLQFLRGTLELSERLLGPYLPLPASSPASFAAAAASSGAAPSTSGGAAGAAAAAGDSPPGPSAEEVARLRHPLVHWVAAICDELDKAEAGPLEFPSLAATVKCELTLSQVPLSLNPFV